MGFARGGAAWLLAGALAVGSTGAVAAAVGRPAHSPAHSPTGLPIEPPTAELTVEILLDRTASDAALTAVAAVYAIGGRITGDVPGHLLQAVIPPAALDAVGSAPGVQTVRQPLPQGLPLDVAPGPRGPIAQAITGAELAQTNAIAWHAAGHTGEGIKIGIVDGFGGASWDLAAANGDLPPRPDGAHTLCVIAGDPCDLWSMNAAHGVAVSELVHEVAPGAELYLATAQTAADLQTATEWFIANGVTIVNRSLGAPLDGPGDGTGPLDAVADYAVAHGIAWFNSAGNEAGRDGQRGNYYRSAFTDLDGDGWHEFADPNGSSQPSGPGELLRLTCDGPLQSSLRWNDWNDLAGATDYDLYVFNEANLAGTVRTAAIERQGSTGALPLEHLSGTPCANGADVYLAVRQHAVGAGTDGDVIEIMGEADLELWSNPYSAGYPIVDSGNAGVFGIGSVGADGTIEYYSSEGPTNDGRVKPDFVVRSDVSTTAMPRFRGTSASAPIAAGLAALVLGTGRVAGPADLRAWFTANALADRAACGPDNTYGAGELVLPAPDAAAEPPAECLDGVSRFAPLAPTRIFDSRPDEAAPGPKGKLTAEGAVDVQVAGEADVPSDATAAVLNVTVTEAEGPGYVTAHPAGAPRPVASAVNVTRAGQTRATLVTVPIGQAGRITLYTKSAAHVLVDVAGYYADADGQAARSGRFVALTPQRLFDTRPAESAPGPKGFIGPRQHVDVSVPGRAGVPPTGVAAVVLNLTGTEAAGPGYLTAFPTGAAAPTASTVNLGGAGATAPNLAIVPLGTDGQITVFASHGAHALADVVGYITDESAPLSTEGLFVAMPPTRAFDTRPAEAAAGPKGFVPADGTITVSATNAGVPADAAAVVLTVTAIDGPPGYLTVWDSGDRPIASTLNLDGNLDGTVDGALDRVADTRANAAMLRLGPHGQLLVYAKSGAHVLADVTGYFL